MSVTPAKPLIEGKELSPEEAERIAQEEQNSDDKRIAQILTRGRTNARLQGILNHLPADKHGFFARNTDEDIEQFIALGYQVETGLKDIKGLHSKGDGSIVVGDVVLMTTSKKNIESIRRVEAKLAKEKIADAGREGDKYVEMAAQQNPSVPGFFEKQEN